MWQFAKGKNPPSKKDLEPRKKPWVEKYRPKTLDDVAYQEEAICALKKAISCGNLNHLLFYGPPGTGKTSTILAAVNELYGPLKSSRVLELNASDERGISIIRNKVKQFSKGAVGTRKIEGYPCPSFKVIILDECDSMTGAAQSALRRTMEEYSKSTRFCLVCNYVTRIIPPVASRCAKFRFRLLPHDAMIGKLVEICEAEKLNVDEETCTKLIEVANGDMRKCINYLQSAKQLKTEGEAMSVEDVLRVSVHIPEDVIQSILTAVQSPQFDDLRQCAEDIVFNGHSVSLIFERLCQIIGTLDGINDYGKGKISLSIACSDSALQIEGADEFLQLQKVLSVMANVFQTCGGETYI